MAKTTRMLAFIGIISLTIFVLIGVLIGMDDQPSSPEVPEQQVKPPSYLTVSETLGSVYTGRLHEAPLRLYRRANPEAKASLYKILDDPSQRESHTAVWRILGYIGDDSDVTFLRDRLQIYRDPSLNVSVMLDSPLRSALLDMFDCIGMMCRRDLKAARHLVDEMSVPEFWSGAHYRLYGRPTEKQPPAAYDIIVWLIHGYALSQKADVNERATEFLKKIQNPALREELARALDPKGLNERPDRWFRGELAPVSAKELEQVASFFNGDLEVPGPSRLVLGADAIKPTKKPTDEAVGQRILRPAVLDAIKPTKKLTDDEASQEAVESFHMIGEMLLSGKFPSFMDHALDNGRPVSRTKRRELPEFKGDLTSTQTFLRDVRAAGLRPKDFQVSRQRESPAPGEPEVDVVSVSFKLDASEELARRLRPVPDKRPMTVAEDGNLLVQMKLIAGRWYWNPFGW